MNACNRKDELDEMRLNILYQFNEKYAPYAGVSITSLFENNKAAESIYIYILGEELSAATVVRLRKLGKSYNRNMIFVDTTELIEMMKRLNMPTYRDSYAANLRLFVDDIAKDEERLLYLDADTIVTGDLSKMYAQDIKTVGMVYDTLGCKHKYDIGLSAEDGYYNSGVILYDLKRWQEGDFTGKIINHVKNVRAQYPSPDQDLINVVVRDEITPIDISCNYQPHLKEYSYELFMKVFGPAPFYDEKACDMAKKTPIILHAFRYLGEFCWHKGNVHPFREEFDKYFSMSLWNDYVKLPADGGIAMRIEKLLHVIMPKGMFLRIFKMMHRRFFIKAEKLSRQNVIHDKM